MPANPSLSFTLDACRTKTSVAFSKKETAGFSFDFLFDGKPKESFHPKIAQFFERIESYVPFLKDYHLAIASSNTFPHSSGIASSASGMAALASNLMDFERQLNPSMTEAHFYEKASFLARLGSGSACRSVKGKVVIWGDSHLEGTSDLFGTAFPFALHSHFDNYQDTILLIDEGEKKVSSTVGHELMHGHAFADSRFAQARENLKKLESVLRHGELDDFMAIAESEALTLHAMMMASIPYFILMKPNTLRVIEKIWAFRADTKLPVCFTLDAGANVHVLYPEAVKDLVLTFIKTELAPLCQDGKFIADQMGNGAEIF